jgi:hypothetical protein
MPVFNPDQVSLPKALQGVVVPQTTTSEYVNARPDMVRRISGVPHIEERIGAAQAVGDRVWFGKTFYDGEGFSGVGSLGYLDATKGTFTFLGIPELRPWSVSALLAQDQIVWAGLVSRPEGADHSGGLLRHDLQTSKTRIYPVEDLITSLHESGDSLIIGTANGIYVLRGGRLVRHRVLPDARGRFLLYTDVLP